MALITGAAKGIGKVIAAEFVAEEARVCVNDIVGKDADKTAEEVENLGGGKSTGRPGRWVE